MEERSKLVRRALNVGFMAVVFASCGGRVQTTPDGVLNEQGFPTGLNRWPPGLPPAQRSAGFAHRYSRAHGWMASDIDRRNLLYVSADDSGKVNGDHVYVFAYPSGKSEGVLTGFTGPAGLCTDKTGDVFVTNYNAADVVEYAHGGTQPIKTLAEPYTYPIGCSIDPTTGNLAVTNAFGPRNSGSIAIYPNAKGAPQIYEDSDLFDYFGCAYDDAGNLFVVAYNNSLRFAFAELPKGSATFTDIMLSGKVKKRYGLATVQWDGKHVALGNVDTNMIYQVNILGSRAKIVGSTVLSDGDHVDQFSIPKLGNGEVNPQGKKLVGPDYEGGNVHIWEYPAGGVPIKTITDIDQPAGTAISKAPRRSQR